MLEKIIYLTARHNRPRRNVSIQFSDCINLALYECNIATYTSEVVKKFCNGSSGDGITEATATGSLPSAAASPSTTPKPKTTWHPQIGDNQNKRGLEEEIRKCFGKFPTLDNDQEIMKQ